MHNFFSGVDDELMELESDKKHLLYDERRANKFFGNAVEKSFKVGTGHDFMECVPPRRCRPLTKFQTRYFIETGAVYTFEDGSTFSERRACVEDTSTDTSFYEVPEVIIDGVCMNKEVHLNLDRGSIGRYWAMFMLHEVGINGTGTDDSIHIMNGFLDDVVNQCGDHFTKKETVIAYNALHAPYGTATMWKNLEAHQQKFFAGPMDNPVVFNGYQLYCEGVGIPHRHRYTQEHLVEFWAECRRLPAFRQIGGSTRSGRWGQWNAKHHAMKPQREIMLMPLTSYGIQRHWWPSVQKSPLNSHYASTFDNVDIAGAEGDDVDDDADVYDEDEELVTEKRGGDDHETRAVRDSDESVRVKRGKMKNSLEFMTHVFANRLKMRRLDVHEGLQQEFVEEMWEFVRECKSSVGQLDKFQEWAGSTWLLRIAATWEKLVDPAFMNYIGLSQDGECSARKKAEDREICNLALEATRCLTWKFGIWQYEFSHGPLMHMCLLLSDLSLTVDQALLFSGGIPNGVPTTPRTGECSLSKMSEQDGDTLHARW